MTKMNWMTLNGGRGQFPKEKISRPRQYERGIPLSTEELRALLERFPPRPKPPETLLPHMALKTFLEAHEIDYLDHRDVPGGDSGFGMLQVPERRSTS